MTPKSRSVLVLALAIMAGAVLWPADASAQYHRGGHVYFRGGVYDHRPYYYYPYWNWYGYGFGFGYPYAWGPYPYYGYPYYYGAYDYTGAARLEVKPREAQVYVDGYFVGVVDDFDGTFQRLNLEPGEHSCSYISRAIVPSASACSSGAERRSKSHWPCSRLGLGKRARSRCPIQTVQAAQPYPARGDRMPPPQGPPSQGRAPVPSNPGIATAILMPRSGPWRCECSPRTPRS